MQACAVLPVPGTQGLIRDRAKEGTCQPRAGQEVDVCLGVEATLLQVRQQFVLALIVPGGQTLTANNCYQSYLWANKTMHRSPKY